MNKTLVSIALISMLGLAANVNANTVLVGLSDNPYPGTDHDFQDLTFSISGANLSVATTTTDFWDAEPGQSIPTGTPGQVDALVSFSGTASTLTFEYGPLGLVAGATGHGNSTNYNEVWFSDDARGITTRDAAEKAGLYFFHGDALSTGATWLDSLGNLLVVSAAGQTVSASNNPGAVDFHFAFDLNNGTGGHTLDNGGTSPDGAYLAAVPEPGSLVLLTVGLLGFGALRSRRAASDSKALLA